MQPPYFFRPLRSKKGGRFVGFYRTNVDKIKVAPTRLQFLEPPNFTKGFLAHRDGLVPGDTTTSSLSIFVPSPEILFLWQLYRAA